jgi:hypothetical protein
MSLTPLKLLVLNSGQKQLRIALNTGIHHTRLNLILNGWIKPNENEKKLLSQELGKSVNELFPVVS